MYTVDHKQLSQWDIACHKLRTAKELRRILRKFTRGTYELYLMINGRKITIKFGMTADENQGDRVYRQIWRFPGWPSSPSDNAAGNDLDDTVDKLLELYPQMTKDDLYVHIWDMSNLTPMNQLRPEHEPFQLEGQLILEYYELNGSAPIGNKREQQRILKGASPRLIKSVAPDRLVDSLFDIY
jgi:hypothetical protein